MAPSFNYVIVKHLNLTQFLWNNLSDVYLWYHIMNVTCSVWKSRSRCSCTCKYWCKYKLYSEPRQSLLCPKVLLIYLHIHACILFCIYVLLQKKIYMLFPRNILDFFLQILCLFLNERNICFNLEGNKCIYIISKVFTELLFTTNWYKLA